jgi:hypothetical protein
MESIIPGEAMIVLPAVTQQGMAVRFTIGSGNGEDDGPLLHLRRREWQIGAV